MQNNDHNRFPAGLGHVRFAKKARLVLWLNAAFLEICAGFRARLTQNVQSGPRRQRPRRILPKPRFPGWPSHPVCGHTDRNRRVGLRVSNDQNDIRQTLQGMTDAAAQRDMNTVFAQALLALDLTPSGPLSMAEHAQVADYIATQPALKAQFERALKAHSGPKPAPIVPTKVTLREIFDPDDFEFVTDVLQSGLPPLSLGRSSLRHDPAQRRAPEAPVQKQGRHGQANRHPQPDARARPA